MALGRGKREQAQEVVSTPEEMSEIDPADLPDQAEGQVPLIRPGSWTEQPPEVLPQFTYEQAREKYGGGGSLRLCVNCEHLNFDSVYGIYHGACKLRPRKESRVEMDFTCEEFEMV